MKKDIQELQAECSILWLDFNNCKAHFPYLSPDMKGRTRFKTAPYYLNQGFSIELAFSRGLSDEDINRINRVSSWLNKNFIIRLYAFLDFFGVIRRANQTSEGSKIDFTLQGAEHINIVRRLRHCFAHSSGEYDPENEDHQKTVMLIKNTLGISIDGLTDWPISIDTVLKPLLDGCISYANQINVASGST